jgi:hypothetical protein
MAEARVLRARGSHLYPGARTVLEGGVPEAPGPCLVEFADGAAATGEIAPERDGRLRLGTAPYRTGAGTAIPGKQWLLEPGGPCGWRVVRAAPGR